MHTNTMNMNNTRYGSLPLRPEEYGSDDDDDSTISTLSMPDRYRCGHNNVHTWPIGRPIPIIAMLVLPLFVGVVWLGSRFNEYPTKPIVAQTTSSSLMMYGMSNHPQHDNGHDSKYGRAHVERHSNGVIDLVDDDYVNARVRPHDDIDIWDAIGIWGINHPRSIRLWAASNQGGKPSSFPQDITFADLAALLVPAYFKDSVDACLSVIVPAPSVEGEAVTSTSVMPGEVYTLRKTLLKTRDLFDIFSTVYPTKTNVMTELFIDDSKDLWRILRVYLMDGYRLIGDFQDLSHAKIMYTPEQLTDYQVQVWTWKTNFMTFVQENLETIFDYLYTPCNQNNSRKHDHCRYAHAHVSHLFWGNTPTKHLPHGNVDKAKHVLARLGNIQLKRAEKYLHTSLTYEYILNSTKATIFTTSSRTLLELESSGNESSSEDNDVNEVDENSDDNSESKDEETDESEEDGDDPDEVNDDEKDENSEDSDVDGNDEETNDSKEDEDEPVDIDNDENEESNEVSDGDENDEEEENQIINNDSDDEYVDVQLIYHNCRKQLRGFLDELSIFGNLLLPNTSVIPELLRNSDTADTSHNLDPAAKILTDQAVKKLDETRTVLGDLNDAYVSHQFYEEHDMYPDEQLRLQISVESKWRHFRKWQTDNDLVGAMHVLRTMMLKPNLKWSLAPSISPIPTSELTVSPITPASASPISNVPTISPTTASPLSEEPTLSPTKNPVTDEPTSMSPSSVTTAVKEKQHKKKRRNGESPEETTPESDKEEQ